ncbi:hypothetical protein FRB95_012464 [Tulasnella sp. JGI-2019a]|nr:hypothetical protein FRB95_012464 [Tulasnella sp. JGI-2019a]
MQVTSEEINEVGTNFPRLEKLQLCRVDDQVENAVQRSAMPALRSLLFERGGVIGEFTLPLINNILRTSPLLETISFTAAIPPSMLELVWHDGVRGLDFNNSYRLRSELETRNPPDLSIIGHAFPKLERLNIISSQPGRLCSLRESWYLDTLSIVAVHFHHLQSLVLSLHVPISSLSTIPEALVTLPSLADLRIYLLYIAPADIDPFISYLAALCPNILCEISEDAEDGDSTRFVSGDGPAFVKRFFGYNDQIRVLKVSDGDPSEESHLEDMNDGR